MSNVSEFYLACRNGDLNAVRQLLPCLSDEEKSSLESNGSTALHAASYFGHHDIVKLLLENDFDTWILNRYEKTPYDEAKDEQMRQLFHRPDQDGDSNRFSSTGDCFSVVTKSNCTSSSTTGSSETIPKGWINGYKYTGTVQEREETVERIVHAQMMKYCLKKFQVSEYAIPSMNKTNELFRFLIHPKMFSNYLKRRYWPKIANTNVRTAYSNALIRDKMLMN